MENQEQHQENLKIFNLKNLILTCNAQKKRNAPAKEGKNKIRYKEENSDFWKDGSEQHDYRNFRSRKHLKLKVKKNN